jgi:hypothetical protein
MGDLETMTVVYADMELAAKQCNPSVVWRSGALAQQDLSSIQTIF